MNNNPHNNPPFYKGNSKGARLSLGFATITPQGNADECRRMSRIPTREACRGKQNKSAPNKRQPETCTRLYQPGAGLG